MNWFGKNARKRSTKGKVEALGQRVKELAQQVEVAKMLSARALIRDFSRQADPMPLAQAEFKVSSQFGDDGIIQYVLQRLDLPAAEQRFVEFGVESYLEANTRFLLVNNNWGGLIMDGSEEAMAGVRSGDLYWRYQLTALGRFITRENINALLREGGVTGRIGLLSIDIDGNDYWVWEAIEAVDPAVVIVEYNGLFGGREAVTIPYQADFTRRAAHVSNLYWGCSLPALDHLARRKGYVWIGTNSAGNNAYFVRQELAGRFLRPQLPGDFKAAKYREGSDAQRRLTFIGQEDGFAVIGEMPVWDVAQNRTRLVSDLQR